MSKSALTVAWVLLCWPVATSAQTTSGWVLWEMTIVTKAGADSVRPDGRSLIYEVTNAKPRQTVDTRFLCFPGALDPRARQAPTPSPKR
jgi:hypothetical protein